MGGKGSGGANGGPQYSPANVSATGGNGQSGTQSAKYYSGLGYGQGQATMQQQQAAPMAGNVSAPLMNPIDSMPQVTPLSAPTEQPDVPVTDGAVLGAGAGTEALMLPTSTDTDSDKQRLLSYLPALEVAAQSPNSSQAFRNYVRILRANLL
jgi:hypothetical protein